MKIHLLYFDGCPHWQSALKNLRTALSLEKLDWPVELVKVEKEEDAARFKFLGSPSIHVDGTDLWPEDRQRYLLSCRLYLTPDGQRGWPTVSMLREALKDFT
jgi:hypothetical protein